MHLVGQVIKNAVELKRVENGLSRSARRTVGGVFDSISDHFKANSDRSQRQAARSALAEARREIPKVYDELFKRIGVEALALANRQSSVMAQALSKDTGDPVTILSRQAILASVFWVETDGRTLEQHVQRQRAAVERAVQAQVAISVSRGESMVETRERLEKFAFGPARRRAQALAATTANATANEVQLKTFQENPSITDEYRLLVTLDKKTSIICLSYAGEDRAYKYGRGPVPPFHCHCRTIIYPVTEPADRAKRPDGEAWLRSQNENVQDEVLGKRRAGMWRRGEIGLAELVSGDKTVVTVKELGRKR